MLLVIAVALSLQSSPNAPSPAGYSRGKVVQINHPSTGQYEYNIFTPGDGYVGRSTKPIHVTMGKDVRFKIKGQTLYVIDDEGKVQRLRYVLQYLPPPLPPPATDKR
jgi:hypothetical protein